MNVVITNPPAVSGRSLSDGCYCPRGMWSVASFAKQSFPEIKIRLLDGNLLDQKTLVQKVFESNPDLLGISTHTTFAYPNCLELLETAKRRGVPVVIGGIHASYLPQHVSKARGVDVIYGQGEEAFASYVRLFLHGGDKRNVPSLCWNADGNIRTNPPVSRKPIHELPLPDHSLLDFTPYWNNFKKFNLPTEKCYFLFTHEGCKWRDVTKGGCKFCTLPMKYLLPPPESVWREIQTIIERWGAPVWFRDFGDCLSGDWDYVQQLINTRPSNLIPKKDYFLQAYVKSGELWNEDQAKLLRKLGVVRAYVGYDSGNNRVLRLMRKGASKKSHELVTHSLLSQQIEIEAGFVLGMESEDRESLEETLQFAEWLKQTCGDLLKLSSASPVAVLPGSPMFFELATKEPHYLKTDNPDIKLVQKDWLKYFCPTLGTDPEDALNILQAYSQEIASLAPWKNWFGWDGIQTLY